MGTIAAQKATFQGAHAGHMMTVYGVMHSTRMPENYLPIKHFGLPEISSTSVSRLFSLLRDGTETGPLGVEGMSFRKDDKIFNIDLNDPSQRYFIAVYMRGGRNKIEVRPLEETAGGIRLSIFQHSVSSALDSTGKIEPFLSSNREQAAQMHSIFDKLPQVKLRELDDAVNFQRSIEMLDVAKGMGLKRIVIGLQHAFDMDALGNVNVVVVKSNPVIPENLAPHMKYLCNLHFAQAQQHCILTTLKDVKPRQANNAKHKELMLRLTRDD